MPTPPTSSPQEKPKLEPAPWTGGSKKDTRAAILEHIAQSGLADHHKAMLTEEVNRLDPKVTLVRLDFFRHDYNGGGNGGWTVVPIN